MVVVGGGLTGIEAGRGVAEQGGPSPWSALAGTVLSTVGTPLGGPKQPGLGVTVVSGR